MKPRTLGATAVCAALCFGAAGSAPLPTTTSPDGTVTHQHLGPGGPRPSPYRHAPGELLVRFRPSVAMARRGLTHQQLGTQVVREFRSVEGLQLVRLPAGLSLHQAVRAFRRSTDVLYAEPNYVVQALATPNDPRFPELWGLQSGSDADIDAPEAWDLTTGSSDAVVAVIDTGVDYTHPDLSANLFRNSFDCDADGIDDDGNGHADDCYGIDTFNGDSDPQDDNDHGTHVAGTIGAVGNNGIGVTGVSWTTRILSCKFLNAGGAGFTSGAVACLDYVASLKDRGVNLVATNNSWGGGGHSAALRDAILAQQQRGILFVAAAGNDGRNNEIVQEFPCSYPLPNVLCVAATDSTNNRAGFSNYGKRIVHLGAPGVGVLSTVRTTQGGYAAFNGTSMAAPHVTGTVALVHARHPGSDWRAVRNRILASGDPQPSLEGSTVAGRRLNAFRALACNNSVVLARLAPQGTTLTVAIGTSIVLSALHVNCADPNGNVTVSVAPSGDSLTLLDDGQADDLAAGDGIYAARWRVPSAGDFTLAFPNGDVVTLTVDPDLQAGFPVKAYEGGGSYHGGPAIHTLVADLDGDPGLEILLTSLAAGPLNAWNPDGTILAGWPVDTQGAAYVAAGELSSEDAGDEVFSAGYAAEPDLMALRGDGTLLSGWPMNSANYVATPPSLADVDGDGLDEIFVEEEDWAFHAYRADGSVLGGWPQRVFAGGQERHTPAIADLDGDGDLEIVTASGSVSPGGVTLFAHHHSGVAVTGFPIAFDGLGDTFPVVGDVDGDGIREIAVVAPSSVLLVGPNGAIERSLPFTGRVSYGSAPALADLDSDGIPEIIVQTDEALNVLRGDGTAFPGWPQAWSSRYWAGSSSPAVGDVDGDGLPEIVVTNTEAGSSMLGLVRAYRRDGTSLPRFPKELRIGLGTVPAIADIDRDGHNEIIVGGNYWDGISGYYDKVWVFDLGGPTHGPVLWGQFMGNAKHTGTSRPVYPEGPAHFELQISISGNGHVASTPQGIDCGVDCSEFYVSGTPVVLTATPAAGHQFVGWTGACAGQPSTCTLTISADISTLAEFGPVPPTFDDVPLGYWAHPFVEAIFRANITAGCSVVPRLFCPGSTVSRDQMAVFMLRGAHGASYMPPPAAGLFGDLPIGHWATAWAEAAHNEGFILACSTTPLLYCPEQPVYRDIMSVYLLRARHGIFYTPPPAAGNVFEDVPASHPQAAWIEQLFAEGLTAGCSITPRLYCPTGTVTRDQMATFLTRTFNLPM